MNIKQVVFDKVVAHSRQMTEPAIDHRNMCQYRTADGNRCFIGALIKGEFYNKKFATKWLQPA